MFNLIMTIICSTSIALILKQNDTKEGHPVVLLMGNYLIATILGFVFMANAGQFLFNLEVFLFGAVLGSVFVISFFLFTKGVSIAGAALSTVSSRLSVIIPILLSIFIYSETPEVFQLSGFVFAIVTIFFFYRSLKSMSKGGMTISDYLILSILLLGIGLGDFGLKVFQHWRIPDEKPFFLFSIFFFAFIYTSAYVFIRKIKIDISTLKRGAVLGIPNIFSSFFLLGALNDLPAIIVYPIANIGIILTTTFGAVLIWKERLNKYGKLALVSGLVAIGFLSI